MTMDVAVLRAWWWQRQGLDGSLAGVAPADVLERCGWARSVGGAGPYLTLFARAGTARAEADAAVQALAIHELPAARGCTYVLPAADYAVALRAGASFGEAPLRAAASLGVDDAEVQRLCDAVLAVVGDAPMDPDAIRAATGDAARSLGEAGKKKGVGTTLPLALGVLQRRGAIRRVPPNGRLDQQRYGYVRWRPGPLDTGAPSEAEAHVALARRFFRWVGPATAREFQWFSGLGVKAAAAAMAPLALVPAWEGSDRLLLPDDVADFRTFEAPSTPRFALVSSLDPIVATRRDHASLLDDADAVRQVMDAAGEPPIGRLADLPSHAILERGRLVGLWEYDAEAGAIAWATFEPALARSDALVAVVQATQAFVHDQLGDARAFSLDSPARRAPRLAAIARLRDA